MCSAATGTCAPRAALMAAPISSEMACANSSARSRIRRVDAVEQRGPALRGTHRPGREGAPGRGHGHRNVLRVAQRDLRDGFVGRRVDDGASILPCGQDPLAVDEEVIQAAGACEALDDGGVHRVQRRLPWQTYFSAR